MKRVICLYRVSTVGQVDHDDIYCAHCGSRLAYYPNVTRKKLADGTTREYERHVYRCYRRTNAKETCNGMNVYKAEMVTEVVLQAVRQFFARIKEVPSAELLNSVCEHNTSVYQVAYKKAEADYQEAHRQIAALEEQTVKALTGENSIDISIINSMMPKYQAKFEKAKADMETAKVKLNEEKETNRTAVRQVKDLREWAEAFDKANKETRHMILARLIDRVEVGAGYHVTIKFKITYEQFMGRSA